MIYRPINVLLAALLFVLFGCSGSSKKQLSTNNRVIEWELSDFQALNPVNSTDANATYTEEMIYQRLLTIDPNTMKYTVPILATSLPFESPDRLQYDFQLR